MAFVHHHLFEGCFQHLPLLDTYSSFFTPTKHTQQNRTTTEPHHTKLFFWGTSPSQNNSIYIYIFHTPPKKNKKTHPATSTKRPKKPSYKTPNASWWRSVWFNHQLVTVSNCFFISFLSFNKKPPRLHLHRRKCHEGGGRGRSNTKWGAKLSEKIIENKSGERRMSSYIFPPYLLLGKIFVFPAETRKNPWKETPSVFVRWFSGHFLVFMTSMSRRAKKRSHGKSQPQLLNFGSRRSWILKKDGIYRS